MSLISTACLTWFHHVFWVVLQFALFPVVFFIVSKILCRSKWNTATVEYNLVGNRNSPMNFDNYWEEETLEENWLKVVLVYSSASRVFWVLPSSCCQKNTTKRRHITDDAVLYLFGYPVYPICIATFAANTECVKSPIISRNTAST